MKPILEIQSLSKKFTIQHEKKPYLSLRDSLISVFKSSSVELESFYALKDVSFEVFAGESMGIIGKNGAGKSTLLKILSKITPPSSGKIISRGRIASLLEVGTGFHPELSGRENVFLNGSILGMKRIEIQKNFDAIIDFAGVEKFLDTPLKHYSSGMQLRLAFAVAAFLENEILIIDEVLAVGDAEFQKKCMDKMDNVSKSGRTILFVSHNMTVINSLCTKCLYLQNGQINAIGPTEKIVTQYLNFEQTNKTTCFWEDGKQPGDAIGILHSARIINELSNPIMSISIDKRFGIEFTYEILSKGLMPMPNIHLFSSLGECVFVNIEKKDQKLNQIGKFKAILWIPENLLNNGTYKVDIALSSMVPTVRVHFHVQEALYFEVIEDISKRESDFMQSIPGMIRPKLEWNTVLIS